MFVMPAKLEKFRVTKGFYGQYDNDEQKTRMGAFQVTSLKFKGVMLIVAADGMGWEHVSVSFKNRTPTWDDMCLVKDWFWGEDDFVVQMHPPKGDHVNFHQHCLHLFRKTGTNDFCERPPALLVGPKT